MDVRDSTLAVAVAEMASEVSLGVVIAAGAAIASFAVAGISVLTFWVNFSSRITKAEDVAGNALQEAAEAKNDFGDLRELVAEMARDHGDALSRAGRDHGESLIALRQHVTDLAMFVRDNFVRTPEFVAAMKDVRDGQRRLEEKIDEGQRRLEEKLDRSDHDRGSGRGRG